MVLSVFVSFVFIFAVTFAATTISTNISTGGTLSVTGLSSLLGGATTTQLTLLNGEIISNGTDGVIQMNGIASSTSITLLNGATITNAAVGVTQLSGIASTTSLTLLNGATITNATANIILVGGSSDTVKIPGTASTTSLTLLNGETITNATDGKITFTAATTTLIGVASTSAIQVGDEANAPTINGMVFGYCSFSDVTGFTASTTQYVDCATTPTGALLTGDRVFVQATSSFETGYQIEAASTTGISTINLRILNNSIQTADNGTLSGTSINFWALR